MATSISQNIKKLLADRNLTQKELAEAIGVSNGTLSDWPGGRFYPRKKYIDAMAQYFNVSVDEITKEKDTNQDERLMSLFNSLSDGKLEYIIITYLRAEANCCKQRD